MWDVCFFQHCLCYNQMISGLYFWHVYVLEVGVYPSRSRYQGRVIRDQNLPEHNSNDVTTRYDNAHPLRVIRDMITSIRYMNIVLIYRICDVNTRMREPIHCNTKEPQKITNHSSLKGTT